MSTQPNALRLAEGLVHRHPEVRDVTCVEAAAELRRLHTERDKLRAFAQAIMEGWPYVGTLDGFDLQELAVKHGLLAETTHHKPCAEEGCNCAEMCDERDWQEGVQCYRSTALLKGAA